MITENDKSAIHDIQGTGGFRVIEFLLNKKIEELDKCTNIDESLTTSIEGQALGRKLAVNLLKEFLSDIHILQKPQSQTQKTFE